MQFNYKNNIGSNSNSYLSHGLNKAQLISEIEEGISIQVGIIISGNIMIILSRTELNSNQKSIIETILKTHQPKPYIGSKINSVPINKELYDTTYKNFGTFSFSCTKMTMLTNIRIISQLNSGQSYDIRIYDRTNRKIICEKKLSNTSPVINDLGNISNLPHEQTILNIQGRTENDSTAFVSNLLYLYE